MKYDIRRFYKAMHSIIDAYYFETFLDDIGGLAGSMALAVDENATIDPAIWGDWIDAIKNTKASDVVPETLTIEEGYEAALIFFNFEADLRSSKDLIKFIETITYEKWLEAVEAVEKDECLN